METHSKPTRGSLVPSCGIFERFPQCGRREHISLLSLWDREKCPVAKKAFVRSTTSIISTTHSTPIYDECQTKVLALVRTIYTIQMCVSVPVHCLLSQYLAPNKIHRVTFDICFSRSFLCPFTWYP